MARGDDLLLVRSDKDTHFTTALAQNAMDVESLTIPDVRTTLTFMIRHMTFLSDQDLDFDIYIWSTEAAEDTDLDADRFVCKVPMDTSISFRLNNTGVYYHQVLDLEIPYRDQNPEAGDAPKPKLYVGLANRDVTSKNAGATGEVVFMAWLVAML